MPDQPRLRARFKSIDKWTILRAVGNSPLVKLTILIPVLGWLILFNDYIYYKLSAAEGILGKLQVSSRLLWLYVGLFTTSIGSMIYGVRCPEEIRKYGSAVDYSKDVFDHLSIRSRDEIEWALEDSKDGQTRHDLATLRATFGLGEKSHRLGMLSQFDKSPATFGGYAGIKNYINGLLDLWYRSKNRDRRYSRWSAAGFYIAGFGIFSFLGLLNLYSVVMVLVRSWFSP